MNHEPRQPATETQSVVIERDLPHAPEKVWRALTQQWLITDWLMPNDFVPEIGHRFRFTTSPMPHWDGIVDGEVLAVEPHRCLSYRWNTSGAGGLETIVTWTLEPIAAGVRLRMEQAGFRPDQPGNYQGAQYGWQRSFAALEQVVAGL